MFKVQEEDLPGDALSVFNLKDDFEFIQNVRASTRNATTPPRARGRPGHR